MSYITSAGNMPSKILYINSEDASQYLATKLNADGTTSPLNCYFNYILKENIEIPLNQRAVISLNSATIPYSFYNIRQDVNDSIDIKITNTTTGFNYTPTPLILPDGNYDVYSLAEYITTEINKASGAYQDTGNKVDYTFAMVFSTDNQKYTYTATPKGTMSGENIKIELLFHTGVNAFKRPYIELGFRVRDVEITNASPVISDNVVDMNGSVHGVYIRTNLVSDGTLDSQNGVFSNILARLPINVNSGGIIFATPNNASHKSLVDLRSISQLTIRLTDDRNRLLDLNGLHFQIAVEINFVYGEKPINTPNGRNIDDSFYGVKSDTTAQQRIQNAKLQAEHQLEMEKLQRNKKPVGRPRKVGRPKGSTKIKEVV
jgi:hypothetical protein